MKTKISSDNIINELNETVISDKYVSSIEKLIQPAIDCPCYGSGG